MPAQLAQIVIPVHAEDRPVRRAIDSVLRDPLAQAIVVCHNVHPSNLDLPTGDRLSVVELKGSEGMPGAAFDAGIAAAEAPWVGILGSDDWLQAGAVSSMLRRAGEDRADFVLAPLAYQAKPGSMSSFGGLLPKTLRTKRLLASRDRLFYRTAPLGVGKTKLMQRPEYSFGDQFPSGSDVRVSTRLWSSGLSVSYHPSDPAYVVGSDAKSRTTTTDRPLAVQGAAWEAILDDPWVRRFDSQTRNALVIKILRVHVHGRLLAHLDEAAWSEEDFEWLSNLTARLLGESPEALRSFRAATAATLAALADGDRSRTFQLLRDEADALSLRGKLPTSPADLLMADGPLRNQMVSKMGALRTRLGPRK